MKQRVEPFLPQRFRVPFENLMTIMSPPQQMLIHATLRIHTIWGVCTLPRAREWRKGARVVWTPRFRRDSSHSEFGGRRGSFGTRPCPPRLLCPWAVCSVPSMPSAHLRHPRLRSRSTQNLEHLLALLAISFHFSKPRLFYAEDTFGPALPLRPFTQTFPGVTVMARFSHVTATARKCTALLVSAEFSKSLVR